MATTTATESLSDTLISKLHLKALPEPRNKNSSPLKSSGALDVYEKFDVTPVIGTEFARGAVQLKDLLEAPNADDLIRDLAILISSRGVVFFRAQELDLEQQKTLGRKLGELSGKPDTSGLHIHPLTREVWYFCWFGAGCVLADDHGNSIRSLGTRSLLSVRRGRRDSITGKRTSRCLRATVG